MTTTDQPKAPERRLWHLYGEPAALTRQQFMCLWSGSHIDAVSEWDKAPLAPEPAPPPFDLAGMRVHVAERMERTSARLEEAERDLLEMALSENDQEEITRLRIRVMAERNAVCVLESWRDSLQDPVTWRCDSCGEYTVETFLHGLGFGLCPKCKSASMRMVEP